MASSRKKMVSLLKYLATIILVVMVMTSLNGMTITDCDDDGQRSYQVPRLKPGPPLQVDNPRSGGQVFQMVYGALDQNEANHRQNEAVNTSTILIHAHFRSGSTFTSDFFQKNSLFYYLYEPFYLLQGKEVPKKMLGLLVDLFDCNFERLLTLAEQNPKFRAMPSMLTTWKRKLFCWQDPRDRKCGQMLVSEWEQECRKHAHRVIKSIRVPELELLQPLMESGLKVVQLIRDPRGMLSSRRKMGNITLDARKMQEDQVVHTLHVESRLYCLNIERDLRYAHYMLTNHVYSNNTRYFETNYHPVRYEDLASQPKQRLLDLYTHFNLPADDDVINWADEIEARNTGALKDRVKNESKLRTERNNSTETASAWRQHLPFEAVQIIQRACGGLMRDLGYILVPDEKYLLDVTKPVMLPL